MASFSPNFHSQVNEVDAMTDVSLHDAQEVAPFTLWSPSGHGHPYELKDCINRRENTNSNEAEEETDLQGLVSNILDEGDTQGSLYYDGSPSIGSTIWCSTPSTEEFPPYFRSQYKQDGAPFLPSHVPSEAFLQGRVESAGTNGQFPQQPGGSSANQQWHVSVTDGDRDSLFSPPRRRPPGLPVLRTGNHFQSQMPPSAYHQSADLHQANHQPVDSFHQISDVFQQPNENRNPLFDLSSESRNAMAISHMEQYLQETTNQLVSGFQSLLAEEPDRGHYKGFPNMQIKTEHPEESMAEQWKILSGGMPMFNMPPTHIQKQLEEELCSMTRGRNDMAGKPIDIQGWSGFGDENAGYFPQTKPIFAPLNPPNQHQTVLNRNTHLFYSPRTQQGHVQHKMKPQTHKDKKRTSGWFGQKLLNNARVTENNKRPHVDLQPNMQKATGENHMPLKYPAGDLRRTSWSPMKYQPKDTSRHTAPNRSGPLGSTLHTPLSHSEAHTGDGYGSFAALLENNQGLHVIQLYFHLDECYEEWKNLENEWKKTEVILAKTFPGEWTPSATNPCGPLEYPLKVEDLLFNLKREQSGVECLLYKMECLCNVPLHANVCTALSHHHMAISCVSELVNMAQRQRHIPHPTEDKDTVLLVFALKELAGATRKLRTALWCALQMSLPEPVKRPDHQDVNREETHTHSCPSSPNEGYSFRI
ncbi:uncharacterized protein LOC133651839 isoform X1 [Entelurus aequoreus]|uniref:uncharacterized protein LOC133651839 isoform X1 n=2 Tax=Entelurus aequoreus TaxID=161455 RepID=UPI002B1E079A|nr:uncharacterized protein LOC133651839 isoform X1 [Entelurus aequoreus]